LADLLWMLPLK